jgi:hypothetical protein
MIGRRDNAVRSLVTPLTTLLSPPETPNFKSKWYFTDDPALVVLYKQLREKSLQTLKGAMGVGAREEWEFVLHTAGLYTRMGCDLLALDLVKTWEFLAPASTSLGLGRGPLSPAIEGKASTAHQSMADFDFDPRKLLRRRSSLVVADLPPREHTSNSITNHVGGTVEEDSEETDEEEEGNKKVEEKKPEVKKKPPPTQFTEPDAGSLLDAFGF